MIKLVNQPIVFALELVMLYSFGHFAYSKGSNSFTRYAFAIAAIGISNNFMVASCCTQIQLRAVNALPGSFQGKFVFDSRFFSLSA